MQEPTQEVFPGDITFTIADGLSRITQPESTSEQEEDLGGSDTMNSSTSLTTVRNGSACFQVHISSDTPYVLSLDNNPWLSPLADLARVRLRVTCSSLPDSSIECFILQYVNADCGQKVLEALSHETHTVCASSEITAVYVRIWAPAEIGAGSHTLTLQAFAAPRPIADEAMLWTSEVCLTIADVQLPIPRDYTFHLDLWQHLTSLATHHHTPLWSDSHFEIIDRYLEVLGRLGQKAVTVVVSDCPWAGQQCYMEPNNTSYLFEHSIINTTRRTSTEHGTEETIIINPDFTNLDRLIKIAERHGMDQEIELIGLVGVWSDESHEIRRTIVDSIHTVRVPCIDSDTGCLVYLRAESEFLDFAAQLHDHLNELGVLDRVRVCADEPKRVDLLERQMASIKEVAQGFSFKSAIDTVDFLNACPPLVRDKVPIVTLACVDKERLEALRADSQIRNGRLLWYVCCWPPQPNTFLSSPLTQAVIHGWLTHFLGFDGFLRWNYCLWPKDPWDTVSWRYPSWKAGDMYFVLPGLDGRPVETLRLEALRVGIMDFELLRMCRHSLSKHIFEDLSERLFHIIFRTPSLESLSHILTTADHDTELFTSSLTDFHVARAKLIDALVQQASSAMDTSEPSSDGE